MLANQTHFHLELIGNPSLAPFWRNVCLVETYAVPLSSNATLEGFATVGQIVFHTYVKSSCGASWGCWGGTTGGVSICSGTGSSIQADCIDGKDDAGILYYITGVCHQIANRILSPAGIQIPDTFPDVRNSYFIYDEYGHNLIGQTPFNRWPDRKTICSTPSGSTGPSGDSQSSSIATFSIGSGGLMNLGPRNSDPPDRRSKLSALIRAGLGHPVNQKTLDDLAEMQSRLRERQLELASLVTNEKISREEYIAELDEALKRASVIGEKLLGFDDFHKVFGEFRVHNLGDVPKFVGGRSAAR